MEQNQLVGLSAGMCFAFVVSETSLTATNRRRGQPWRIKRDKSSTVTLTQAEFHSRTSAAAERSRTADRIVVTDNTSGAPRPTISRNAGSSSNLEADAGDIRVVGSGIR